MFNMDRMHDFWQRLTEFRSRRSATSPKRTTYKPPCLLPKLLTCAMVVSLLWAAAPAALAQIDTGSLLGTVTDPSGALISQASVTIRNEDTGLVQTQKTKANGSYLFTALKVGYYTVSATAPGFEKVIEVHVGVSIQAQVEMPLKLNVGHVNSTVVVSADQASLQTQDASVGQVVSEREINNLPLNGRNYTLVGTTRPGYYHN